MEASMSMYIDQLTRLLRGGETEIPQAVLDIAEICERARFPVTFGRNSPASGCKSAANGREFLGRRGIALWNELKSMLLVFTDGEQQRLLLAHCRADRHFDLARIAAQIEVDEVEKAPPELVEQIGIGRGLINPFGKWIHEHEVFQIVDDDLAMTRSGGGIMMTNAGHHEWSVRFNIHRLIPAMGNTILGRRITQMPTEPNAPARTGGGIGILTGNPVEAGTTLLTDVMRYIRRAIPQGEITLPRWELVGDPDFALSMELPAYIQEVEFAVRRRTTELCKRGIKLLLIPCNTLPYFSVEVRTICEERGVRYLSMPDVVGAWLRHEGIANVDLLGIPWVADTSGEWSAYTSALDGVTVTPYNELLVREIRDLAYRVKADPRDRGALDQLRLKLQGLNGERTVFALTELSLLSRLPKARLGNRVLDPMDLYAQAAANWYAGKPFPGL